MTIEHELNQTFVNNLQYLLFSNVTREGESPGRLEELVQESPGLRKRRLRLETRRTDLLKIQQKLNTYWSLTRNDSRRALGSGARRTRSSSVSSVSDYRSVTASTMEPMDYEAGGIKTATPPDDALSDCASVSDSNHHIIRVASP